MSDLNIKLVLKAQDLGSDKIKQLRDNISKTATETIRSSQRAGQAQSSALRRQEQEYRRSKAAMSRLGMRSEQEIQREIRRTQQAYRSMAQGGRASQTELARAARITKQQISELNAEMGKSSRLQRLAGGMRTAGSLAAGVTAAGMVLQEPMKKQRSFDLELAYASATAFGDRDQAGMTAGKQELYDAVKKATQDGGGTREEALTGLNTLLASGAVPAEAAKALLPVLQKASTASGASSDDLAKIAIALMQNFKVSQEQIPLALDKAIAAGQAGAFELSDMARSLPSQLAAAQNAGMGGMDDFDVILRSNQQARTTAGNSNEAGTNMENFLGKLVSSDAVRAFGSMKYRDTDGKIKGIDLAKSLMERQAKGQNTIDAFMGIIDQIMAANKDYQSLQKQINTAEGPEKQVLLEKQANILEGTQIGEMVGQKGALLALLGIRNATDLGAAVMNDVQNSSGATDKFYDFISSSNESKVQGAQTAKEFSEMEAVEPFNKALADLSQKVTDYAAEYPDLAKYLAAGKLALTALAAAAAAASVALAVMGGGGILGKGKGIFGKGKGVFGRGAGGIGGAGGAGGAAGGTGAGAAGASAIAPIAIALTPLALMGGATYLASQTEKDVERSEMFLGLSEWLQSWMPDFNKSSREEYMRKREELGGNNAPDYLNPTQLNAATYQQGVREGSEAVGEKLNLINSTLASQQQVIQNNISVNLDGRIVAEQVAMHQVQTYNRGAGQ